MSGLKNKAWVIHFSADDYWHSNPHSRHHITAELNKHYSVVWVNPLGSRIPSIKKKGFSKKILRKLSSLTRLFKKVTDTFYVITPFYIPHFSEGSIQRFNSLLLQIQLRIVSYFLKIRKPLLLFTTPVYANMLDRINHKYSVYYYSDQYTAYREFTASTRLFIESLDKKLYKNADLILCASQKIFDNVSKKTDKKVIYFPHQVDFQFFYKTAETEKPSELKNISSPVIGYYGTLTDSNDWELIKYCSEKRPGYNFVFIGRKDIAETGLENSANVFFLGKKPFAEIPSYGHAFDVGIMFWIVREWIMNCSPLKLKEYLSLGIPVVSTYIEEVERHYKDIVYITKTKEDFLNFIDKALTENNSERIQKGINKVRNDSWYNAVKIINKSMKDDLEIHV